MSAGNRQQHAAPTQQQHQGAKTEFDQLLSRSVRFTPFAETEEIELSFGQVKNYISAKTKNGLTATDADIVKFMMLCKARGLNPWVGDAYLVGYDAKDGPTFTLITSHQALMKRAEAHAAYNGMQSGVVVQTPQGQIIEREGDIVLRGEDLIGAWAKCYRKDRAVVAYDSLNLAAYDKGRSQWEKDKAGMIVKCAEASVLRKSFPSQLAGLYIRQEEGLITAPDPSAARPSPPRTMSDLMSRPVSSTVTPSANDTKPEPESFEEFRKLSHYEVFVRRLNAAETANEAHAVYEEMAHPDGPATEEEASQMDIDLRAKLEQLKGSAA